MPVTSMHSPHQLLGTVPQPLGQAVAGRGQEELAVHRAELPLHVGHCLQQPEPGDMNGTEFGPWVRSNAGTAVPSPRLGKVPACSGDFPWPPCTHSRELPGSLRENILFFKSTQEFCN